MDKIFIHALKAEAIIGIYDWERQVRQTVLIDLEIGADIRKAALTDSIDDTLELQARGQAGARLRRELAVPSGRDARRALAMLMLEEFGVAWVRITLSKPGAVRSSRDVGVSVERDRGMLETWRTRAAGT